MSNREVRPRSELDARSRNQLEELLAKSPSALTDAELAHLRARSSYLSSDELSHFGIEGGKQASPANDQGKGEDHQAKRKSLKALKVAQLEKMVVLHEVEVKDGAKKDDLVEALIGVSGLPHEVSEEDLANKPELEEKGVSVGDVIMQ